MTNISKFRFEGYSINKSVIEIDQKDKISKDLKINFDISGIDQRSNRKFDLNMCVTVIDKTNNLKVEIQAVGNYLFDNECGEEELGDFFNFNAPAILFPYLRAHIATLSTLCGLNKPLLLPTLNLSNLANELKQNTTKV